MKNSVKPKINLLTENRIFVSIEFIDPVNSLSLFSLSVSLSLFSASEREGERKGESESWIDVVLCKVSRRRKKPPDTLVLNPFKTRGRKYQERERDREKEREVDQKVNAE